MSEETKKEQTTVETVKETTTTPETTTQSVTESQATPVTETQVTPITTETTASNAEVKSSETKPATKKQTWLNRIWSAITGAILAVAAMFGITSDQIAEQKENVKEVQTLASEALTAIKSGDVKTATAKLTEAGEVGKEVVSAAKETAEKVKEALTAKDKKAVNDATKQYTETKVTAKAKVTSKK